MTKGKVLDLKKPKVIIHNLTFKGIEIVPGILDFDQRGIVYAGGNDVVVTKNKPDEEFVKYLETLGWDFKKTIFISSDVWSGYSYNSVFHNKRIDGFLRGLKNYYLDTYNTSIEEESFARRVGMPIYANCKVSQKYGTKSGFRKLAKKLNFKIADGVENINDVDEALREIERLFSAGKRELVIKIDEGVSGAGTTKIKRNNFKRRSKQEKRKLLKKAMFGIKQISKESGSVIEEWLQDVVASPSIQVQVFPNRNFQIISMHDQIFEKEEKWYVGCVYPPSSLSSGQREQLLRKTKVLTGQIIKEGFIGFFGLDFVLTSEGEIYWTEANMRKPATFYPRIIAEKLNDGVLKSVSYIATDFTVPKFKGRKFREVKNYLRQWLYPINDEKRGVVLYNIGALKEAGRFDAVCLGHSDQEALGIYSQVKNKVG